MAGVNGIEIKVGQVWRTRGGALATVVSFDDHPDYPVNIKVGGDSACCGRNGRCWGDIGSQHTDDDDDDLIELVKDAAPQPTDSATLAEETLVALGWTFDGQAWVENAVVTMVPNALDVQVGGTHYKDMGVQPWAAFDSWLSPEQHVGYLLGTAIAYLARFNSKGVGKGGLVDVEKATHTLQRLVEVAKKGSANED